VTSVPFDVPIFDDNIYGGNESFVLEIVRATVAIVNPDKVEIFIIENEGNYDILLHSTVHYLSRAYLA